MDKEKEVSLREHINLAERHTQAALRLAYKDKKQPYWIRLRIAKAQSILIALLVNQKLK